MKSQTLILLIVAAGCGLVAMLGVQQVLNKKGENETQKIQVLQASMDISLGVPLNDLNTEFVFVDLETCPEGAVTDPEQIADRSLLIPVNTGDWITEKKLSAPGERGISVKIPDGMQVATIPVDPTTSHSGMLQPGHRVDLMINYTDKNELGERISKVRRILQYVEVFAVDNKVYGLNDDGVAGKAKNISLLVTPDQALFLELAKTQGRMSTVLRRNDDSTELAAAELSADELDGGRLPDVNTTSARDANRIATFDSQQESADSLLQDLQNEFGGLGGSKPTAAVKPPVVEDTWTIAIWDGTDVRLDIVNLHSDLPVPDTAVPDSEAVQMPDEPAAEAEGETDTMEELDGLDGLEGMDGLELFEGLQDAASDLWSLVGEK